jgi:hypothetical protein
MGWNDVGEYAFVLGLIVMALGLGHAGINIVEGRHRAVKSTKDAAPESYVTALARELDILREFYRSTTAAVASYEDGKLSPGALVNSLIGSQARVRSHDCRIARILEHK